MVSAAGLQIWVLAASTGGIDAVTRFLRQVPRCEGVALIYVQHLYEEQHRYLLRIVERNCDWRITGVNYGAALAGGTIMVPSAEERFDIDPRGIIGLGDGAGWLPPYRPSADDIAMQVASRYGPRSGLIVFSGMGADGSRGAAEIEARGGQVWVQSPRECAAVAMPEAVLAATRSAVVAPVDELAARFIGAPLNKWRNHEQHG